MGIKVKYSFSKMVWYFNNNCFRQYCGYLTSHICLAIQNSAFLNRVAGTTVISISCPKSSASLYTLFTCMLMSALSMQGRTDLWRRCLRSPRGAGAGGARARSGGGAGPTWSARPLNHTNVTHALTPLHRSRIIPLTSQIVYCFCCIGQQFKVSMNFQ